MFNWGPVNPGPHKVLKYEKEDHQKGENKVTKNNYDMKTNPYYYLGKFFGYCRKVLPEKDAEVYYNSVTWYMRRNLISGFVRANKWLDNHNLRRLIKVVNHVLVTDTALAMYVEYGGSCTIPKVLKDRDACEFEMGYTVAQLEQW